MCLATTHDEGAGVGNCGEAAADELRFGETAQKRSGIEHCETTIDLLREKNAELHELQARLLSAPRSSRKTLQKSADLLDDQIRSLKQDFVHTSEVQRAAVAVSDSITGGDPNDIATALQRFVDMPVQLEKVDDLALCYLIGASENLVEGMKAHPSHPGVIEAGCHALCKLFAGLGCLDNGQDVARQLSRADVGDVVIRGMTENLSERDVQFYACRVLSVLAVNMKQGDAASLSFEDTVAHTCFVTGGRVAVSKARRAHVQDQEVTQWADTAMRLL